MKKDYFIDIPFSSENLDNFLIRTSILKALNVALPLFKGKLLDTACGKMPYKEYIISHSPVVQYVGLDIKNAVVYDEHIKPDFLWDGITMPFQDAEFDCAFGTEVLEHCFEPEIILNEICRVLKPGGIFFFTVPFIWNLHEIPNDAYRYTPFALQKKLNEAGFKEIAIHAYGGWHSSLAQMLGLWVRRSPIHDNWKKFLSILFKPFIRILINSDKNLFGHSKFDTGIMIPGLFGICKK